MKRLISLLLVILALLPCLGCASTTEEDDTICFYYVRDSIVYGTADGVIAGEERQVAHRVSALPYLISLYLRGPQTSGLHSPFPEECKLENLTQDGSTLCVTLSRELAQLEDLDLTVACSCLAKTCFSLADVTQVQIQAFSTRGSILVNEIISIDSLLLTDMTTHSGHEASEAAD